MTCQRCNLIKASYIVVSAGKVHMRETHLCRPCRDDWRSWRLLIYGPDAWAEKRVKSGSLGT